MQTEPAKPELFQQYPQLEQSINLFCFFFEPSNHSPVIDDHDALDGQEEEETQEENGYCQANSNGCSLGLLTIECQSNIIRDC